MTHPKKSFESELSHQLKELAGEAESLPPIQIDHDQLYKKPVSAWITSLKIAAMALFACGLGIYLGVIFSDKTPSNEVVPNQYLYTLHPSPQKLIPKTEYVVEKKGDLIIIEGLPPMRKVHTWNVRTLKQFNEIMRGHTQPYQKLEKVRYEWQEVY